MIKLILALGTVRPNVRFGKNFEHFSLGRKYEKIKDIDGVGKIDLAK